MKLHGGRKLWECYTRFYYIIIIILLVRDKFSLHKMAMNTGLICIGLVYEVAILEQKINIMMTI